MLNAKRVDKYLVPGRTGRMYCFDTVVSTNVVAEALVAAGEAADGYAVAADSQTRGAGTTSPRAGHPRRVAQPRSSGTCVGSSTRCRNERVRGFCGLPIT